ncbi:MAG: SEC-C domain-containing protein, partial [Actinobacteria bacterium]|nr:SEC-C domain-containing protein [Actinomycetota bacterium]
YVLGSERHESRRIDNQLRGRSGRQGDPGESRFYLSLEDELMRLFATGAMQWVMSKTLEDDVPIEAKMVTKAIERAQTTVEQRNAEIRKDVLKYDEVMNQQRKVIYARRMQILEGENLREHTLDLLDAAIDGLVESYCSGYQEEWDVEGLLTEVALYYPSKFTADELRGAVNADEVHESLLAEAVRYYEEREQSMPVPEGGQPGDTMRELEREVMLQIIDQKWREHLAEMDYLREGINLRAMGQQDPLVAWQREGYDMFGRMVAGIDDDYLRYVMHVEVLVDKPAEPDLRQARYEAADEPVQGQGAVQQAALAAPAAAEGGGAQASAMAQTTMQPVMKSDEEKLGRNQPCWCGSGKKFKLCHGR